MAKRKVYDKEFKLNALQQWQASGKSAAEMAEELGISTSSLYTWRDQLAGELASTDDPKVEEPSTVADEESVVDDPGAEQTGEEQVTESPAAEEPKKEKAPADPEESDEVEETENDIEDMATTDELLPEAVSMAAVVAGEGAGPVEAQPGKDGSRHIFKRILGGIAAFLGGLGLLLSLALIIVVWVVNQPVTDRTVELVGKVEAGLVIANTGLNQADDTLDNIRQQLRDITDAVPLDGLQTTITDIQALVDGIKSTVDTAVSVVGLADTFPVSLLRQDAEPVDTPKLNEVSGTLGEISTGLGEVNEVLAQRQESGLGPVGTEVDNKINEFQISIGNVNQGVEDGIDATGQLQEDLPGIIDTIAIILTLLFLWLGLAQYALLVNGWHWVRLA